jgi:hypothetical protein
MQLHIEKLLFLLAINILIVAGCNTSDDIEKVNSTPVFTAQYAKSETGVNHDFQLVNDNIITKNLIEVSGIVSGRKNKGVVYMHEDSGNRNVIFVFDTTGVFLGEIVLVGVQNRDWEDIAIGPGPEVGVNYIYVGDIGDNRSGRPHLFIYRFEEPDFEINPNSPPFKLEINTISTIKFNYPDGARDAETLMINPKNLDLVVITKREVNVHVYTLPYPQRTDGAFAEIDFRGKLPFRTIVGGDISPDGNEILIKDYGSVYHWTVTDNDPIKSMFLSAPNTVEYVPEVQGESVGWSWNGNGYFTISETEKIKVDPILYHYRR